MADLMEKGCETHVQAAKELALEFDITEEDALVWVRHVSDEISPLPDNDPLRTHAGVAAPNETAASSSTRPA